MIDLNNTWCEATEENYNEIIKLYDIIYTCDTQDIKYYEFLRNNNGLLTVCAVSLYEEDSKQIHLVNGEFQFVETKPKNNFKEYGFEANFEGEILKEIEDMASGKVFIGYIVYDCKVHSCVWQYNGVVITRGVNQLTFNLKPIKKEWYENHENFPCIATKDGKNFAVIESIDYLKRVCIYPHIIDFRPATKEEVLTLLVKE